LCWLAAPLLIPLAAPNEADVQCAVNTGLGGAVDLGTPIGRGDDTPSFELDITTVSGSGGFNYFGTDYTSIFINQNGNITFDSAISTFTPFAFPQSVRIDRSVLPGRRHPHELWEREPDLMSAGHGLVPPSGRHLADGRSLESR
jgi:hypothetical protein